MNILLCGRGWAESSAQLPRFITSFLLSNTVPGDVLCNSMEIVSVFETKTLLAYMISRSFVLALELL